MAMGIVSDNEFDLEKSKLIREESTLITPDIVTIERGRGKHNVNVPNNLRNIIGETSEIEGRKEAIELAKQFGIKPSSVSAYANGATSTSTYDNQPNIRSVNLAKERVAKRARTKLMLALNSLSPDKIGAANARDISGIAKDMSVIVKNMEPEKIVDPDATKGPTFVFYAPQIRDERNYETIIVKE